MAKRIPSISEIKRLTAKKLPFFFSPATMKFFGQKLRDFKVYKNYRGMIFIFAKKYMVDHSTGKKKFMGFTCRRFHNNDLKFVNTNKIKTVDQLKKYLNKKGRVSF